MSDQTPPRTDGYLPAFHEAQIEIAQSAARYKVVSAGRRFGKGILGIAAAFRYASRGGKARWIAPSYASDSYQSGWNWAKELAGQIPGVDVHLQRREINFANVSGGWLQFKTAEEPDSLRGEGIDFVVFDEAAHVDGLEEMWEQCVRPSLMDRRGDAWFISTPNGFNYFNTLFLRSRDNKDWESFQFPTSANPHIAEDEIAELRKSLPALVARQEIDAEFVQLAGALFKRQNIIVLETEPIGVHWVRSWDLAFTEKTTSDYTAGVKMGMTSDGTVVITDMVSGRMEWPDAVRCIANTARMDGTTVRQGIEVVSAQVGVLQTLLRDPLLLSHTFTPIEVHRDKLTRALPLVARSEQGKLAIVRGNWNQKFLDELCAFPESAHDDMVDACSGGMTLLTLPTGAIDDRTMAQIKVGTNAQVNRFRPVFTPRRLQLA
jgi:predicted phage terminase large subunit-like protein